MKINITAGRTIREVNEEFTGGFPFLKLEFYHKPRLKEDRFTTDNILSPDSYLKDGAVIEKGEGCLEIAGNMTVLQLENLLMQQYGLATQVFRKSGRVWLQTTHTDSWTLNHQNEHGREITDVVAEPPVGNDDLNMGN